MRSMILFSIFSFCVILTTGYNKATETADTTPVNTVCPIMGGEVTPEGGWTLRQGKTVGFCCEGCNPKWEKLSDEEKAKKLAASAKGSDEYGHTDHGSDHKH